MRIDARNLLDRLGRTDFAYKEFEDRFSELELWPILEALLRDPRLQAIDQADAADAAAPEPAPAKPVEHHSVENLSTLFGRYSRNSADDIAAEKRSGSAQHQDVRAMLRHLSDLGSQGKV